jgi:hypothetical protein
MKIIQDFVGNAHAIQIMTNHDTNIVCLLLLHVFFHLNPITVAIANRLTIVQDDDLYFWVGYIK